MDIVYKIRKILIISQNLFFNNNLNEEDKMDKMFKYEILK